MTDPDPDAVEFEPPVDPTPAPIDPAFARSAAASTLGPITAHFGSLVAAVATATEASATWLDDFWAASGYDKAAVTAALGALAAIEADYSDDVAALAQAPA